MKTKEALVYVGALCWGATWALFLQKTALGRYLAQDRTWVTVVAGVGVDLVLVRPLMGRKPWERLLTVVALSSIGIIIRSLINEHGRSISG